MKLSRRDFLKLLAAGTGATFLAACGARQTLPSGKQNVVAQLTGTARPAAGPAPAQPGGVPPANLAQVTPSVLPDGAQASAGNSAATAPAVMSATETESGDMTPAPASLSQPAETQTATPQPSPTPRPAPRPSATPQPAVVHRLRTWAWLRMMKSGDVPSSEADYGAHIDSIDVIMPLNGGKLLGEGTWLQEDAKLRPGWPAGLRASARGAGQMYLPGVGNDAGGLATVLDNPGLHGKVAAGLVSLAQTRFDAPWDGVFLDLEAIGPEYKDRMSRLLTTLGRAIKDAGLSLGISIGGTSVSGQSVTDPAFDLSVVRDLADFVDLRCYDYSGPLPRSIGPYWWMESVVAYALNNGLPARKVVMGQANYSRLWPNADSGSGNEMTYDQAVALANRSDVRAQWIESDRHGLVRERVAQIGSGRLVIHDGDTYQAGLNIVQSHGLLGSAVFAPGMGDDRYWQAIRTWRTAGAPA